MPHDREYLRHLLQLRAGPRLPIAWLLIPWIAGAWWSVRVARALLPLHASLRDGWGTLFTMVLGREFFLAGGLGTIATWAWLYYARPDHRRVLCWVAAMGLLALGMFPAASGAAAPVVVSLCMVVAILEQVIATRLIPR